MWSKEDRCFVVRLKKSVEFKRLAEHECPDCILQNKLVDEYIALEDAKPNSKYPKNFDVLLYGIKSTNKP